MGGYTVGVASETKAFKQGIDSGVIAPLEDAQKALTETGRNRGLDQLEDGLRDVQRATEGLGDETKDAARAIEREYKDAYRSAKNASDDGLGRMKTGAQEVTQEMGQNLGEAVSSIRGDLSDLGQVGQDTLGGLAATLAGGGPAGIAGAAALAAGAVGLGLITAEMQRQQEEADRLKERLASAYQDAAKEGRNYIDAAQSIAEANSIMFDPDRAEEWKRLQTEARDLGLENGTLIDANAGNLEAIEEVQARYNRLLEDEQQKRRDMGEFLGGQNATQEEQRLEDLAAKWGGLGDAARDYRDTASELAQYSSEKWLAEIAGAESATLAVDEFGNRLIELPSGKQVVIDAETGQATTDLHGFKGDADGVIETLNQRQIMLHARASTADAEDAVTGFLNRNDGRAFRMIGRVEVTPGGSFE